MYPEGATDEQIAEAWQDLWYNYDMWLSQGTSSSSSSSNGSSGSSTNGAGTGEECWCDENSCACSGSSFDSGWGWSDPEEPEGDEDWDGSANHDEPEYWTPPYNAIYMRPNHWPQCSKSLEQCLKDAYGYLDEVACECFATIACAIWCESGYQDPVNGCSCISEQEYMAYFPDWATPQDIRYA